MSVRVVQRLCFSRCSAAVSSVCDGRHTHCLTIAAHAADGRRTMNVTAESTKPCCRKVLSLAR
ncbi:MAG: hypothetical protein HXL35_06310 [Prevotellaceae bacterium]|nr:hypothetical protein [Prevotellaceae bacterium]